MPKSKERPGYSQPSFEGLKIETRQDTMLEWVIVESLPTYRKNGKGYAWECVVSCPPDIFHQGRNETYTIRANTYASEAHKKRLRPGDMVTIKGVSHLQEIQLSGGEKRMINSLTASAIDVVKRAKRESISVYEKDRNTG